MLTLTAKDIMTRNVISIRKGASIDEALKQMACHNVSGLPVVDVDGFLVGIVTESDVLLKGQSHIEDDTSMGPSGIFMPQPDGLDEAYRKASATLVEDAMTKRVLTFSEDSLVVDIARAMIENAVNRVPIVRALKVVGVVSRKDIIRAMARAASGGQMVCEGAPAGTFVDSEY